MLFLGSRWNDLDILWGIFSLVGWLEFLSPVGCNASICCSSQLPRALLPQAPGSPILKCSFIFVQRLARTLGIFLELFHCIASFSLVFCLQMQLLSSPSGALPGLYFPAFSPQRPLNWKLGWSGTNLCISFLSRNTVLHFLFSDTWEGCFSYVLWFCSYLWQGGYSGPSYFIMPQTSCFVSLVKLFCFVKDKSPVDICLAFYIQIL